MKLHLRLCLSVSVLSVLIHATLSNENETDTNEGRQGRVYGRIVKLYSGIKPDPVLCYEEGFKADPTDCSTFYRCVQSFGGKYNVFKFQCGPGTVYDPATEICNHPSNTKRSECRGPILPVQQEIHENDIDFRELPSPISTVASLYLNPKINASEAFTTSTVLTDKYTDIRSSTTSYNTLTTNVNQQFSDAFGYLGSSWSNKYSTPSQAPSSSTKSSRSDKSDPCTNDGFIGDSYDCKKFYRCVNNFRGGFIRYEFSCGESTVWDDDKQSCNYAWAVRSTRCGRDPNDDNLPISVEQDNNKVTSNFNYATSQNQNENIATENPNAINFGDKINNYYNSMTSESPIINNIYNNKPQTTNNYNDASTHHYTENIFTEKHPVANYFTENQYNNYNSQPTENQIYYGVTESHSQIDEVKKDFTSHTTSTEHPPSSSTRENDSSKLLNNMCHQTGFIGDPNDCQKFYRCVDSGRGSFTRYAFSCSQGTVWDSSLEACNHAWAVEGCGNKMATQGLTTDRNAMIPSSSMNINEGQDDEDEDTDNDYGYLNQINQENTKTTTQKIETTFSIPATSEGPSFGKSCSASGFFKNTVDCKKFYKCIENGRGSFTRFDYNCGEGTLWDENIEACNHAWAVKSCKSSAEIHNDTGIMTTVTLVQTTTQRNINTDDYDSIYGLEQSMQTPDAAVDRTTTTSKETLNSNNRQCNKNGFMGDKEDCNKFYRCVENGHNGYIRYEFSCGDGTVWDPTIEACNHARDVEDCRSSSSNNIDDNNQEPTDSIDEEVDNGYVTPSNKDPDNSVQTTVMYTTTPIAVTNNNSNICKYPGFIGDTESCEKFYRCVDNGSGGFSRIEFTCGEGTVWDSSIEACNHRWAVEKCGKGANNEFSETTSQSISTITNDMSDSTTKASEESSTSTQQQPIHSDNKCTSEGFFGMESEDCKKFYRCVDNGKGGYTKYEFSCGDGTIWDESIQACNHASNDITCVKGTPSSTNTPGPDTTSTLPTNSMPTTTSISTANTDAPPHDDKCTSEGFMADSSDCKKFYRCVDNGKGGFTKFEFSCGEGTVWIQEIQACDHDSDESNCNIPKSTTMKISTTTTEEVATSNTQGSSDSVVTGTTSSTTENNNINKNDGDKCSAEGFYPNKNDCKRFYRCVDDGKGSYTKYDFTCAEGTAWDIHSQSCNYIDQASSCQNNKIPQTETKPDSNENSESETQENTTTIKPLSTTSSTRPKENTCDEEGFFGDTEDCKKFYRCVSNEKDGFTKYDFTCGDGTIWDKDITACNHPQDVTNPSCKSGGSTSPSSSTSTMTNVSNSTDYTSAPASTTSTPTSTTSTPTSTTTTPTSTASTPASTTTSPTSTTSTTVDVSSTTTKDTNSNCSDSNKGNTNNNNYTCTKAGFYADLNDCKKFYRCVDWENNGEKFSIFHFDCGDGTIWDPALETCNHEESVYPPRNCNGSQQQNQNNSESSSTTEMPSETESTTSTTTTETTSTTIQPTTAETESTATTTQKSTTQSKPTTTTQKSTTQTSTTESKPTTTTTTTTSTTQKSTTQESTTSSSTTTESSTQQTSTTSREESTTDSSTQSTTEVTVSSNTDQTTTNKEPATSEATSTNSYETTAVTNQMSSTTEQSTTTTDVTTSTEEISPQTTDSQSSTTESTTTTNAQESTTEGTSSNKDCPETEDDQYLYVCPTSFKRHPKYCNMFYQCTDDNDNHEVKVAVFNCPNNTIYDESKTQCVEENKADKKCNGQMAQRKRIKRLGLSYNEPVVVSRDSMACRSAGHFPFEKHEKCSPALLKCEYSRSGKLKGYVYKCPEGFVYWTISRRCEAIRKVKDCKRSSYPWDKRYDIPVETHNISV